MNLRMLPLVGCFVFLFSYVDCSQGASDRPRILYLGDSLSMGAFGKTMDGAMRNAGYDVHTVVAGGATPYYWLKQYQPLPCTIGFWEKTDVAERRLGYVRAVPKIEDLIQADKPGVVVVQTGINLYATLRSKRRPKEENVQEIQSLIEQMCEAVVQANAISYWILPPHSHEDRYPKALQVELASLMRDTVYRYGGTVFESQAVTHFDDPYPATDGVHYGPTEAREWAGKVSEAFQGYMDLALSGALPTSPSATPMASRHAVPVAAKSKSSTETESVSSGDGLPDEVALWIRLEEKSEIHNPAELDYANALGLYEYTVVKDLRGNFPYKRIRVAQGIVFRRKLTSAAAAEIGSERELVLVPLSKYHNLSSWQMVDDLRPNFEIPIYTPKLD